jgi:chromate transport protein ChrA
MLSLLAWSVSGIQFGRDSIPTAAALSLAFLLFFASLLLSGPFRNRQIVLLCYACATVFALFQLWDAIVR